MAVFAECAGFCHGICRSYQRNASRAGFIVLALADDSAHEVFGKVTVAAETILARSLPGLIAGTAPRRPQPIVAGEYFGRRRPDADFGHPQICRTVASEIPAVNWPAASTFRRLLPLVGLASPVARKASARRG